MKFVPDSNTDRGSRHTAHPAFHSFFLPNQWVPLEHRAGINCGNLDIIVGPVFWDKAPWLIAASKAEQTEMSVPTKASLAYALHLCLYTFPASAECLKEPHSQTQKIINWDLPHFPISWSLPIFLTVSSGLIFSVSREGPLSFVLLFKTFKFSCFFSWSKPYFLQASKSNSSVISFTSGEQSTYSQ